LRRPEYRDPLLQHLGDRARRSLLILDEAHTAAPATKSQYAVDSSITHVVRDIAPRFENRLFLSATPHNGHSNSFSSLLEILDPQRFTRGVPVRSTKQLEPIMVRRLKADLRALDDRSFPTRNVIQISLIYRNCFKGEGQWFEQWTNYGRCNSNPEPERIIGHYEAIDGKPIEIVLSELLFQYTKLMRPQKGRGRLVFINLQKRLLSSINAFSRTLSLHAKSVGKNGVPLRKNNEPARPNSFNDSSNDYEDDYEDDLDDESAEATQADLLERDSQTLAVPGIQAQALLNQMLELASKYQEVPDAKVLALLAWIRKHQCPAAGIAPGTRASRQWSAKRVLIFTEYAHTKQYLRRILDNAFQDTEKGDERILELGGGLSDERREEIQRAFNAAPNEHPVRVLIATDAAREGINLQGQCADLFHFDVPWNPARMEQRNGRIDRALQPSSQVHCAYFHYSQRVEDLVLRTLVEKVDRIQRELGALGNVVMDRLDAVFASGIDETTISKLEAADAFRNEQQTAKDELESARLSCQKLAEESDAVGKVLAASRKVMEFRPELLKDALEVGCELAGAGPLKEVRAHDGTREVNAYQIPPLPRSWEKTLDSLRPLREKEETFWDWRQRPLMPVVFEPPSGLSSPLVHLHLQHPFVQRILSRFLAQGFSAHDLSRVTVVKSRRDSMARVIVFGRLTLFGAGAVRLHDELVSVGALWLESGGSGHLRPFGDKADRKSIEQLEDIFREAQSLDVVSQAVQKRLLASATSDFTTIWKHVQDEAESRAHQARQKLEARGNAEAEALQRILLEQQAAIARTLREGAQLKFKFSEHEAEQESQFKADQKHMTARLAAITREIETEPAQLIARYQVALTRVQAVGMIYLWPEGR
jgi:superfamily II DNA/RNA helicase